MKWIIDTLQVKTKHKFSKKAIQIGCVAYCDHTPTAAGANGIICVLASSVCIRTWTRQTTLEANYISFTCQNALFHHFSSAFKNFCSAVPIDISAAAQQNHQNDMRPAKF